MLFMHAFIKQVKVSVSIMLAPITLVAITYCFKATEAFNMHHRRSLIHREPEKKEQ